MKTSTQIILGLAVAATVGAALGMLLAPAKGKDLQNKLKDGAQDWLEQFSTLLNTGRDVAAQVKVKTQDELRNLKSNMSQVPQ